MNPAVLRQRDGFQLSYLVPHSVNSTHVYPRTASNGSTVIVFGHDSGLRVVWYAGRNFKPQTEEPAKVNGKSKDNAEVVNLDDSDDEHQPSHPPTQVAFEDNQDEVDPSEPYHHVLKYLDIPLGTAVLHIAQPDIPFHDLDADHYPVILENYIVLAVACSDLSIRLITCPLTPPAPQSPNVSQAGVQVVKLTVANVGFHQALITALALTFTEQQQDLDDDDQQDNNTQDHWSFLVASTSCTGTGLLLIHSVPIHGSAISAQPDDLSPIRRLRPRAPLNAAKLAFNTSSLSTERQTTILVTIPDASCCKIYQIFPQPSGGRQRRESSATMDSISSKGSSYSTATRNGKLLLTLLPDFLPTNKNSLPPGRRKRVLDCNWIMAGRAIIALLEDGEFGIWDLEAVGPATSSSNKNPIKGQSNISGIVGGSITRFSVTGHLPTNEMEAQPVKEAKSAKLAPATPHTRKVRQDGLFKGSEAAPPSQDLDTYFATGSTAVRQTSSSPLTESLLLTYNSTNMYIPSIQAFWHGAATSGRNTVKSGTFNGPVVLPEVRIPNETIASIAFLPSYPSQKPMYGAKETPNFLISTATRVVLYVQSLVGPNDISERPSSRALAIRPTEHSLLLQPRNQDLDVDSMDQILNNMETSRPTTATTVGRPKPNFGKSVAFARDNEEEMDLDIDMISPSPAKFGSLASSRQTLTQRRLFS